MIKRYALLAGVVIFMIIAGGLVFGVPQYVNYAKNFNMEVPVPMYWLIAVSQATSSPFGFSVLILLSGVLGFIGVKKSLQ